MLKGLSNELSLPLSLSFSKPFSEGELTQESKDAIITPLHKKGEKEFSCNYRPASLTSIVCKVMESIIKDDILAYMVKVTSFRQTSNMDLLQEKAANPTYY